MEQIEERKRCWGDGYVMVAGGPYKATDSGETLKTRGVRRGWKWRQKTDRRRRALEDNNNNGNKLDKGRAEAAENSGRETAASRGRGGSLHRPSSGIYLPLHPTCLRLEAEEREVMVLELDEKLEDCLIFFSPCRCIN